MKEINMHKKFLLYCPPRTEVLLTDENCCVCEESRYNSNDNTEYFGDGGEEDL